MTSNSVEPTSSYRYLEGNGPLGFGQQAAAQIFCKDATSMGSGKTATLIRDSGAVDG